MKSSGGGWTLFQRRFNGSVDFYRNWTEYKGGFGDLSSEFWLGLDKIHRMSHGIENVLRIEMEDFEGEKRYAEYSPFQILNECEQYKLIIGNYSGWYVDRYVFGMACQTSDYKDKLLVQSFSKNLNLSHSPPWRRVLGRKLVRL